jgi:hypothetical protein
VIRLLVFDFEDEINSHLVAAGRDYLAVTFWRSSQARKSDCFTRPPCDRRRRRGRRVENFVDSVGCHGFVTEHPRQVDDFAG